MRKVVHYELLEPNQTVTAAKSCLQLDNLRTYLAKGQHRSIEKDVVLKHDNNKPHTANGGYPLRKKLMVLIITILLIYLVLLHLIIIFLGVFSITNKIYKNDEQKKKNHFNLFFSPKPRDIVLSGH